MDYWLRFRFRNISEDFRLCFHPTGPIGSRPEVSTASVSFHPHCGTLVKLSNNNRTAERQRAAEEFKNAIVLSSVPLRNDELFEVSKCTVKIHIKEQVD